MTPRCSDLIRDFNRFVENDPTHFLRKKLSYGKRTIVLSAVGDLAWDDACERRAEIDSQLRDSGGVRAGGLSQRSLDMAWHWVARAYEYGVAKGRIPSNPLLGVLPKNPRNGRYF